jgi:pimeloyl-ACP methyl ester carboxylesterase
MTPAVRFVSRWLKRLGIALVALLVFIFIAGNIYRIVGERRTLEDEPPGKLVDIGTHRLHLLCAGEGSPTVILNSSVAGIYRQWAGVIALVAPVTRICAFDRSGLGWSEAGPVMPPTAASVMQDLERLLAASGESPPWLHVGFSLGAILSFQFVEAHPDETVGFVSIEGFSPEMRAMRPPLFGDLPKSLQYVAPPLEALGLSPVVMLTSDLLANAAAADGFSRDRVDFWRPAYFLSKRRLSNIAGGIAMSDDLDRQGDLGDLPFIVIQGDQTGESTFADPDDIRAYEELQARYHLRSTQGEFVLIPGANHGGVMNHPDVIAAAITRLVERARAGDSE